MTTTSTTTYCGCGTRMQGAACPTCGISVQEGERQNANARNNDWTCTGCGAHQGPWAAKEGRIYCAGCWQQLNGISPAWQITGIQMPTPERGMTHTPLGIVQAVSPYAALCAWAADAGGQPWADAAEAYRNGQGDGQESVIACHLDLPALGLAIVVTWTD